MSSSTIRGGIPPSRPRRSTVPIASARPKLLTLTASFRRAQWKKKSGNCNRPKPRPSLTSSARKALPAACPKATWNTYSRKIDALSNVVPKRLQRPLPGFRCASFLWKPETFGPSLVSFLMRPRHGPSPFFGGHRLQRFMKALILFVAWCILFVLCWPVALLALGLLPLIWLISLPLRLVRITLDAVFAFFPAL